jgi:hypothetical protein
MHAARKTMRADGPSSMPPLQASYVGCSGWRYWKWRGLFYPVNLPEGKWFDRYAQRFDTVELNASFYSWPTVENVKLWRRQPGKRKFDGVKVPESYLLSTGFIRSQDRKPAPREKIRVRRIRVD